MKKILFGFAAVLIGFGFNGCSSGKNIEVKQVQQIHKGRTTEAQIRKMFGEPTRVNLDYKHHKKILTYDYANADTTNKTLAGVGTAVATIALGPIGLAGGYLAANNVQDRTENKNLTVTVDTRTKRVIDYNYNITQGRTSGMGLGSSIGGL